MEIVECQASLSHGKFVTNIFFFHKNPVLPQSTMSYFIDVMFIAVRSKISRYLIFIGYNLAIAVAYCEALHIFHISIM